MQRTSSLALLGAIYSFTLAAAGSLPRGVGPEFVSFYEGTSDFACVTNAAIKLSLSQVNDNHCDCPDGSDEPGTAACAYLDPLSPEQPAPGSTSGTTNTTNVLPGFWCPNAGHIGAYVPFSYVNDGVCDYDLCCDGAEEYGSVGGVKCKNKCTEIGKEHRKLEEQKRKNMEKAGKKRHTMVVEAEELRKRAENTLASLKDQVAQLEAKKEELQRKHAQVEQEAKGKVFKSSGDGSSGGKLAVLVGVAKARVEELRTTLGDVLHQRDRLDARVEELEAILTKFKVEYNPNFNDEGVKAAVRSFEDYVAREAAEIKDEFPLSEIEDILKEDTETEGVNWKEFDEIQGDDTDILYDFEAYLPPFVRSFVRDRLGSLKLWLIENGVLADNRSGAESRLVKAAREAVDAAEKELKSKRKDLDREQTDFDADHGPSDIFRALKGKCVSSDAGEYTYELCWLGKTSQKSKKGGGNTNMGNYKSMDRQAADDEERLDGKSLGTGQRMVLRYEDGQSCWNGPKRRTDVWLGCAETEEVWRVSESEKCVYKMEVGTPAACEVEENVQQPRGKDEL